MIHVWSLYLLHFNIVNEQHNIASNKNIQLTCATNQKYFYFLALFIANIVKEECTPKIRYASVMLNLLLTLHQVALWTLGQQVASTGYVVEPYRKYPSLLEVLLNFLKTEQNQGIRREVYTVASISLCAPPLTPLHSLQQLEHNSIAQ